jgi:hypothetical protein
MLPGELDRWTILALDVLKSRYLSTATIGTSLGRRA